MQNTNYRGKDGSEKRRRTGRPDHDEDGAIEPPPVPPSRDAGKMSVPLVVVVVVVIQQQTHGNLLLVVLVRKSVRYYWVCMNPSERLVSTVLRPTLLGVLRPATPRHGIMHDAT